MRKIIRNLNAIRPSQLPLLAGPSRKGFIGKILVNERKITDKDNSGQSISRLWGTSSAVTACIAHGADIIRVHDVKEMAYVMTLADAIFRPYAS